MKMTPEKAQELLEKVPQREWWNHGGKHPAGTGDIYAGDAGWNINDGIHIARCWHSALSKSYIDSLSAMAEKRDAHIDIESNANFIAAAPAIARAYIALAAEYKMYVESNKSAVFLAHDYIEKYQPSHVTVGDKVVDAVIKDAFILRDTLREKSE